MANSDLHTQVLHASKRSHMTNKGHFSIDHTSSSALAKNAVNLRSHQVQRNAKAKRQSCSNAMVSHAAAIIQNNSSTHDLFKAVLRQQNAPSKQINKSIVSNTGTSLIETSGTNQISLNLQPHVAAIGASKAVPRTKKRGSANA